MPAPILPVIPTMADGRPAPGWGGNKGYGQPTIWTHGNMPQQPRQPMQGMGDMLSMQQVDSRAQSAGPWLPAGNAQPLNTQAQGFNGLGATHSPPPGIKPGWGFILGAGVFGAVVYSMTKG